MVVFYLNLQRRKDREDRFFGANATIARFRRWEAVDGSTLRNEELLRSGLIAEPLQAEREVFSLEERDRFDSRPGARGIELRHQLGHEQALSRVAMALPN